MEVGAYWWLLKVPKGDDCGQLQKTNEEILEYHKLDKELCV